MVKVSLGTKPYYSITQVPLQLLCYIKGHQSLTLRLGESALNLNRINQKLFSGCYFRLIPNLPQRVE